MGRNQWNQLKSLGYNFIGRLPARPLAAALPNRPQEEPLAPTSSETLPRKKLGLAAQRRAKFPQRDCASCGYLKGPAREA